MAKIKKTSDGRVVLSSAEYVHITPYASENAIGNQTYDIVDIVGDSLSFTPEDHDISSKDSEFSDAPVFESVTLGKYQFAATCVDFQNEVMTAIYGWDIDDAGNVYAPADYKDKYALVEVGFRNKDIVVVAPKVKLNSKANLASFKTGTAEGELAGTAYSAELNGKQAPLAFLKVTRDEKNVPTTTYTLKLNDTTKTFKVKDGIQE